MAKRKQTPARSAVARNLQLQKLAVDEAERRLRNGTASASIIIELLKATSDKHKLEIEKLRSDLAVAEAKIRQMEEEQNGNDLYRKAIDAFRKYSGNNYLEEDDMIDEECDY